jgi:hypothetical protein
MVKARIRLPICIQHFKSSPKRSSKYACTHKPSAISLKFKAGGRMSTVRLTFMHNVLLSASPHIHNNIARTHSRQNAQKMVMPQSVLRSQAHHRTSHTLLLAAHIYRMSTSSTPSTCNPDPSTCNPDPRTCNPALAIQHLQSSTCNPDPRTLHIGMMATSRGPCAASPIAAGGRPHNVHIPI